MTNIVRIDMSIICGCSSHDDTHWNKLCKRLPARGCRREWPGGLPCTRLTEVALDPLQQHRIDRNDDQGERHQQRRPPRPQLDSKGWLEHASRPGVAGRLERRAGNTHSRPAPPTPRICPSMVFSRARSCWACCSIVGCLAIFLCRGFAETEPGSVSVPLRSPWCSHNSGCTRVLKIEPT